MKTTYLVAVLAAMGSSLAYAQTNVTVYGVIDAGVRYSSGLGLSGTSSPQASPANTAGLASGVDRSGRFGIKGSEDLGNGYQALFTLETDLYANSGGINPNLGTSKDPNAKTANYFFERQSTVGLAGPFGQVLFGRQQSALRDIIDGIDAINGRFTGFNPNLQYTSLNSSGLVAGLVKSPNGASYNTYYGTGNPGNDSMMRQDNAVKYIAQVGPVTGTLVYSLGGVAGSTGSGSTAQAALSYNNGPLLLSGAYQSMNNDTDTLKLTAYTAGGRYTIGSWQIAANYGSNTADRTTTTDIKTNIYSVGTTYAATPKVDLTLGYYKVARYWTSDAKPDATINRVIGFAEYKLSKRTTTYLELDHNKWGGDPTQFQSSASNKVATNGVTVGIDHTF